MHANVDLHSLVYVQVVVTCDLVKAAGKKSLATVAWGDRQVGAYRQWRYVETPVRLSDAHNISLRMFGVVLEVTSCQAVTGTMLALFVV